MYILKVIRNKMEKKEKKYKNWKLIQTMSGWNYHNGNIFIEQEKFLELVKEAQKELLQRLETKFTKKFGGEYPYGEIMDILEEEDSN